MITKTTLIEVSMCDTNLMMLGRLTIMYGCQCHQQLEPQVRWLERRSEEQKCSRSLLGFPLDQSFLRYLDNILVIYSDGL